MVGLHIIGMVFVPCAVLSANETDYLNFIFLIYVHHNCGKPGDLLLQSTHKALGIHNSSSP